MVNKSNSRKTATKKKKSVRRASGVDLALTDGASESDGSICIPALKKKRIRVALLGTSPIYFKNNYRGTDIFDDKADAELKSTGKKRMSGEQEALASLHLDSDGHICFPVDGFKSAMWSAIGNVKGLTKANSPGLFFVVGDDYAGELVRIYGVPEVASQVGKNAANIAIPMHRMRIVNWATTITIEYLSDLISESNVLNLVSIAGYICGVGDKRVGGKKVKHLRGGQWDPVGLDDSDLFKEFERRVSETKTLRVVGEIGKRKVVSRERS